VVGLGTAADRAAEAARCALALDRALRALRAPAGGEGGARPVAIATGLGEIDGALPSGEVVERARALLEAPPRGPRGHEPGLRADPLTEALLRGRFDVLTGASGPGPDLDAALSPGGPPAPFVGRGAEIGALCALLAGSAGAARTRVALVTGAPGIGKSRLLHELAAASPEVTVGRARCDPASGGAAIGRAWEAIRAAKGTALLVVDDVHWADEGARLLLESALRARPPAPCLVVAAGLPEPCRGLADRLRAHDVQLMRLGPLPREEAERLARAALGEAPADLVARLVRAVGGNPLHLAAVLRAAAEGGGGAPEALLALAQAELDALGPDARRALRAASVLGARFRREGLLALLALLSPDGGGARHEGWIDLLIARKLLVQRGDRGPDGDAELVFRDRLLRDAARSTLLDEDRAAAEALAAAWRAAQGSAASAP
jgi:hypothetical protein